MKKPFILFILFFFQFYFGQDSGFSFRVNSTTEFYDSQSSIYIRRFQGSEISLKLNLTNEELLLINNFLIKLNFMIFQTNLVVMKKSQFYLMYLMIFY